MVSLAFIYYFVFDSRPNVSGMGSIDQSTSTEKGSLPNNKQKETDNNKNRALHITTLKIFFCVTLLIIFTWIPWFGFQTQWASDINMLNCAFPNTCNVFVYLTLNKQFRKDTKKVLSDVKNKLTCGAEHKSKTRVQFHEGNKSQYGRYMH